MSNLLLKAEPHDDTYVVWSFNVDAPTAYGTIEKIRAVYRDMDQERFDRADKAGASSMTGEYGWDDTDAIFVVGEVGNGGFFTLERKNLKKFVEALYNNGEGIEGENRILAEHCKPCE